MADATRLTRATLRAHKIKRHGYAEGGAPGDDYNTSLTDEAAFQNWKAQNAPNDSGVDYDLRGAFLADMQRSPDNGHMGDRFKKPNHPTFSDQSQYAVGDQRDRAGHWIGPEGPDQTFVAPSYAEGGAADLPDAPWAAPPKAEALPDAPWAETKPPPEPPVSPLTGSEMDAYTQPSSAGLTGSLVKATQNVPHSALEFGKNIVQPFIHPVDTAVGIKNLGLGILEKSGISANHDHEKYADAVGKFFVDRYGSLEAAKRTFENDPVGMAGDLAMLLTGGGGAAARLPGLAGKIGEIASATGRVVDPMRAVDAAGRVVSKVGGEAAAQIAGVTTGVGAQPLKVAAEAGYEGGPRAQAFRESITGAAPMEEAVNEARGALAQLRQERGDSYRQAMSKTGTIGADATILDFNKIDNAVMKAEGIQTYSGRYGTGPTQVLSPKTEGIRSEMVGEIEKWKQLDPTEFHSAEGIDALKKKLGDIRDDTAPHTPARVAADRIYNAVRQTIVDQVPAYAKVMKGYEEASKQIKEIETTLSLKPTASVDTALRKLQSTLRDNVNTSFGRRTELAKFLVNAGAPHLMEKLAGQSLQAWMPRGVARIVASGEVPAAGAAALAGHPLVAAAVIPSLAAASPRLMGNTFYGAGRFGRVAEPIATNAARPARALGEVLTGPYTGPNLGPLQNQ
jgi:hypothetical protein